MNDGGCAFPTIDHTESGRPCCGDAGMSLRDWFAGQALAGYMADPNVVIDSQGETILVTAKHCYQIADAMLRERARRSRDLS